MAAHTSSSRERVERNGRAEASVILGFLSVAALPVAVAVAQVTRRVELLDAAAAVVPAALAAALSLWLARHARLRVERTLGRVGGARLAAAGRVLGLLGLCLAVAGAISLGTYLALTRFAE